MASTSTATRTGATLLVDQLAAEGVRTVFGLPGVHIMGVLDALFHRPEMNFITTRHEQGSVYMADGYARATGDPGVALMIPGVGLCNAMGALSTAYACSSPVLVLTSQVARDSIGLGKELPHEIHDQLAMVAPITKWQQRVLDAATLPAAVREAFTQMTTGRPRPVELEAPREVFDEATDAPTISPLPTEPSPVDASLVARAVEVLASGARPLVVAGGGVLLAEAWDALRSVVEHLQAAVVTSRDGKGAIDGRHPLHVGVAWHNKAIAPVLADADVILAVGTRLEGIPVAPGQTLVRIDVDPGQMRSPAEVAIVADARAALEAIVDELHATSQRRASRAEECAAMRQQVVDALHASGPQAEIVDHLRAAIPEEALVVGATSTVGQMCHMYLPTYEPRSYFTVSYMSTLGFEYAMGLGVKAGRPDRPVVSLSGDGGFLFTAMELATAVQYGLSTVHIVFNDSAYGSTNLDQHAKYGSREIGTLLQNPDFAAMARSFGAEGYTVDGPEGLGPAVAKALSSGGPAVIDCPTPRMPKLW